MSDPSKLEVPQATLERIRAVVDSCAKGSPDGDSIQQSTGISRRHVDYALAAARTLSLIGYQSGQLKLLPTGEKLANTLAGSEGERRLFLQAIAQSKLLTEVAPNPLSDTPPTAAELTASISKVANLSASTAAQRAAMMLKWRKKLLSPQLRILRDPKPRGMWRRLKIRNYRSIESADVTLAPFTVVVGPNGSGKSNFADAVAFARDVSTDASAAISNRGGIGGVRRWNRYKPWDVSVEVLASSSRSGLESSFSRHSFKIHSGAQGNWTFTQELVEVVRDGKRHAFIERRGRAIESSSPRLATLNENASIMLLASQIREFTSTAALRNVRHYRLNPDAMRQPQLSGEETRLEESGQNIAAAIRSIRDSGGMVRVIEPMSKVVPGLQDVYVEQVGRYLALKFKQKQSEDAVADFNATEMSEGALRALGIIVATHQMVRDELLIIEEPEVAIHTGAANLLFEVLKEASERGAVLITTHSADLLDAARDEEILVCKYVDGRSQIGPLAHAQRQVVRDGLFSVAELMRSEPLRIEGSDDAQPSSVKKRSRSK